MSITGFKHLRLSTIGDVALIEVLCTDVQGPQLAKEFIAELTTVVNEDAERPLLVDLSRTSYFSSMGYATLFKLVKAAKERRRPIRFCNMHPDARVGAEIVGLHQVVEIHDNQKSALDAFRRGEDKESGDQEDITSTAVFYTI